MIQLEKCENCSRDIGMLETAHLFQQHVVCAECNESLAGSGSAFRLRDYQEAAVENTIRDLEDHSSVLLWLATGLGKTAIAAKIIKRRQHLGRTLFVAHRQELVEQAAKALWEETRSYPAMEQGSQESREHSFKSPVVVASVQSLLARRRGKPRHTKFRPAEFGTIVFDEAHHSAAKSWLIVRNYFLSNPACRLIGLTATPERGDKRNLGKIFDKVSARMEIIDAISQGWLVPVRQSLVRVKNLDYSSIPLAMNDFSEQHLNELMSESGAVHSIVTPILERCGDRKTLIFAAGVEHAHALAEQINYSKPGSCAVVHGKTPPEERREIMSGFREGRFQFLSQCAIATEGFDVPDISLIVMARITLSRAFYLQALGRGTRPLSGVVDSENTPDDRRRAIRESRKPFVEVMDFKGNVGRHQPICSVEALAGDDFSPEEIMAALSHVKAEGASDVVGCLRDGRLNAAARAKVKPEVDYELQDIPFGGASAASKLSSGVHEDGEAGMGPPSAAALPTAGSTIAASAAQRGSLPAARNVFSLAGPECSGRGQPTAGGFLVFRGSKCRKYIAPSAEQQMAPVRERLIASGVLAEQGNQLLFLKDHLFKSPSGAAKLLLGREASGWDEWKSDSGASLNELRGGPAYRRTC